MTPPCSAQSLSIGSNRLANPVVLAPMSGVSDLPFRTLAAEFGAGLVVTEMVASEPLVQARADVVRKVRHPRRAAEAGPSTKMPFVVQLAGREARWMGEGARIAEAEGADVIDINMGCPSKMVTNGQSGSALMRDLDHALTLVEAVVAAVAVPVTLKMRMGWDFHCLNAPELAARAEAAGVALVTVHGRTRNQFFKDTANWEFVARVKAAVRIPVLVNGDIISVAAARTALAQSGADGVMIGRGAYGRPWLPGRVAAALAGADPGDPPVAVKLATMARHLELMLEHYGLELGLKNMRKHLGWYVEDLFGAGPEMKAWRARLCEAEDAAAVRAGLVELAYAVDGAPERVAA